MKKLFKRLGNNKDSTKDGEGKKKADAGGEQVEGGSDDDSPVHDFELAQEDYLVSVALATSASEYEQTSHHHRSSAHSHHSSHSTRRPSHRIHRRDAAAYRYWKSGRCDPWLANCPSVPHFPPAPLRGLLGGHCRGNALQPLKTTYNRP